MNEPMKWVKPVPLTGTITILPDDPDYERISAILHMTRTRRIYAAFNAQYGEIAFNLRVRGLIWKDVAERVAVPTEFAVKDPLQQVVYLARTYALKNDLELPNFHE